MKVKSQMVALTTITILLSSPSVFAQCQQTQTKKYNNPTVSGLRIDKCVQGAGWRLLLDDRTRCDRSRQRATANAFCRAKRYESAHSWRIGNHVGNHSIWTYPKGQNGRSGNFTQVSGAHAFSQIVCKKTVTSNSNCDGGNSARTKRYNNPTIKGMFIDKCVQGAGWLLIDPARCDNTRVRLAANAFCKSKNYVRSTTYRIRAHIGNHSIWSYPKGRNGSQGSWTQVAGAHAFSRIDCAK